MSGQNGDRTPLKQKKNEKLRRYYSQTQKSYF